nr:MAG TPA: hypothetical protein [Caudoviricetes sp.]
MRSHTYINLSRTQPNQRTSHPAPLKNNGEE